MECSQFAPHQFFLQTDDRMWMRSGMPGTLTRTTKCVPPCLRIVILFPVYMLTNAIIRRNNTWPRAVAADTSVLNQQVNACPCISCARSQRSSSSNLPSSSKLLHSIKPLGASTLRMMSHGIFVSGFVKIGRSCRFVLQFHSF